MNIGCVCAYFSPLPLGTCEEHENQDKLSHEKLKHNLNYGKKNLKKTHILT
jgi:hypothetical protein